MPQMYPKEHLFESSHDSPSCPSDKSRIHMKKSMERWFNGTDGENRSTRRKPSSSVSLNNSNLTCNGWGSSLGLRVELCLKTQFTPLSKHTHPRLYETISWWPTGKWSLFALKFTQTYKWNLWTGRRILKNVKPRGIKVTSRI